MKVRSLWFTLVIAGCAFSGRGPSSIESNDKASSPGGSVNASLAGAGPIIVAPEVMDGWRFLYRFVTEVEFVLCLEGRKADGKVYIESFRLARMEAANSSSVRYQPCTGGKYVGTAHNHPPVGSDKSLCYQSLPDRRSFEADQRAVLDIVLCGEDRFYWAVRSNGQQEFGEAVAAANDRAAESGH